MTAERDERAPTPTGFVLKVTAALLVLALTVVMVAFPPSRELDARVVLSAHFQLEQALPFDFRIGAARELATGVVVVELESDAARKSVELAQDEAAEVAAATAADEAGENDLEEQEAESDDSGDAEEAEVSAAERERHALEDGTPPASVYLVRHPADRSREVLARLMKRRVEDLEGEASDGELVLTIDGGRLPWGEFDADFVLEREYEGDGHFSDTLRVNLTNGAQCWVLFALWPRDYRGSREPVERLLDALRPV